MKSARETGHGLCVALKKHCAGLRGCEHSPDCDTATAAIEARDAEHAATQETQRKTIAGLVAIVEDLKEKLAAVAPGPGEGPTGLDAERIKYKMFLDAARIVHRTAPGSQAIADLVEEAANLVPLPFSATDAHRAVIMREFAAAPPVAPAPPDQQLSKADLAEAKRRADKLFGPDPVAPAETTPLLHAFMCGPTPDTLKVRLCYVVTGPNDICGAVIDDPVHGVPVTPPVAPPAKEPKDWDIRICFECHHWVPHHPAWCSKASSPDVGTEEGT